MVIETSRIIGLNPQFNIHTTSELQLLLLSEQTSFRLSGKLYHALMPYLDGKHTVGEIIQAFDGRVPAERMTSVLQDMLAKEYILYLDPLAPIARQALWVGMGLDPSKTERRLSKTNVAVQPASQNAAVNQACALLKPSLTDNGFKLVELSDAELVIVVVEDYLQPNLNAINLQMRQTGQSWLLFKAGGNTPLIGPLFRPQGTICWKCLCLQMQEHRPGDNLLDPNLSSVRPARAYTLASLNVAVGLATLELSRALSAPTPSALESHLLSFDINQHVHSRHLVRAMPHCEVCVNTEDPDRLVALRSKPLVLNADSVLANPDGGWRTRTAEQVVESLSKYVSTYTGIISGMEDKSLANGLPVFTARQTSPVAIGPRQNRLLGRPSASAGKGASEIQAKASCLAEAIERYLCGFTGGYEARMRATWDAVKDAAPHPYSYLNYSELQYDNRIEWNKTCDSFNFISERFDESRSIEWTPAWSLSHGSVRWLPTRACYFNYTDASTPLEDVNEFCSSDSNGCASGSTVEEAIVQGFFELIERDACAIWWYNRVRRPAFDLSELNDPFVSRVQDHCHRRNLELSVLDITNDLGLPVAVAVAYNKADGKSIHFGLGSHFDAQIAVSRALSELNQILSLEVNSLTPTKTLQDSSFHHWIKNHSIETDPYCLFDGTVSTRRFMTPKIENLKQAVDHCVRSVSDRGFDMIVLNMSRPEIDFAAARVVVPGLRHFWARLREGRLYKTPVDLGWLARPHHESELNPVAFFL